jgi:hypothetical protein
MLDFKAVSEKRLKFNQLTVGLTPADLHQLTDEMVDDMLVVLQDAQDADVTFQPVDPNAHDRYAANPDELTIAWTLGHVVVHATASAEEAASLASLLARGLEIKERARYETPWQEVSTVAQLRARLEESRRMRHAFLQTWPDQPHLDNLYQPPWPNAEPIDAIGRFAFGLMHDFPHLAQMREIMSQAQVAR